MTQDEIREKGKIEVAYDRQLAILGKKDADSVLFFWMKGFEYNLKLLNHHIEDNKKMKFMIDNGLGFEDMTNDITYP